MTDFEREVVFGLHLLVALCIVIIGLLVGLVVK
jgi:hypothetical protein